MLNELLKKMNDEYEEYKLLLESCSPRKIIEKSYETTIKNEIIFAISESSSDLDDEGIKLLCNMEKPLDFLYSEWLNNDISLMEKFKTSIGDSVSALLQNEAAEEENEI